MDESFVSPPLFNILCVSLGAALFFAPYIWLRHHASHPERSREGLGYSVFKTAMAVFFAVTVLSFLNGVSVGKGILWPEAVLASILMVGAFIHHRVQGRPWRNAPKKLSLFLLRRVVTILGLMVLTAIIVAVLMYVFTGVNMILSAGVFQPVREATFLIGVLWIGALYWLYQRNSEFLALKFHHLLWPLVLGLLILMAPMALQNFVNSEQFQDSLHKSRPLQRV